MPVSDPLGQNRFKKKRSFDVGFCYFPQGGEKNNRGTLMSRAVIGVAPRLLFQN
jgi:hypothetical protein